MYFVFAHSWQSQGTSQTSSDIICITTDAFFNSRQAQAVPVTVSPVSREEGEEEEVVWFQGTEDKKFSANFKAGEDH